MLASADKEDGPSAGQATIATISIGVSATWQHYSFKDLSNLARDSLIRRYQIGRPMYAALHGKIEPS